MADINVAFNLIVQACNDPNIGYSQDTSGPESRYSITLGVPYRTKCDCASIIAWALTQAGFFTQNPWFTTLTAPQYLIEAGFTEYPAGSVNWESGDIVHIRTADHHHMEMVYQGNGIGGITMGAHEPKTIYADEVSINTAPSSAARYVSIFKSGQTATLQNLEWIQSPSNQSYPLNDDEMRNNAIIINAFFSNQGWTRAAIAGMLGNFQAESALNPNRWQGDTIGTGGYGLAQWTPASNYRDWANEKGYSFDDANVNGNGQLEWIQTMSVPFGQWLPSREFPAYHYTFEEFQHLTDVAEATKAWLWQFERAGVEHLNTRLAYAQAWYDAIPLFPSDMGNPPPTIRGAIIDWELRRRLVKPF